MTLYSIMRTNIIIFFVFKYFLFLFQFHRLHIFIGELLNDDIYVNEPLSKAERKRI